MTIGAGAFFEINAAGNLVTGTAALPDGTPIVYLDIPDIGRRYVWKCSEAIKTGAHIIRLAESAMVYSFIRKSLEDAGMTTEQATAHIRELDKAISEKRNEEVGIPLEKPA